MSAAERPSKKQRELLTFIDGFIKGHGYGPSYREVMRAMNYKSVSTVAAHIDGLIVKGQLRKKDQSARSLEVVQSNIPTFATTPQKTASDETWLLAKVATAFEKASLKPTQKAVDNLFVLVGALHVLKLPEAATQYKKQLKQLQDKLIGPTTD